MIQGIVNFLALLAVLMLGAGILLVGMAAMAAVYGCVFAKDDDRFVIGVDFGRRHAEVEERAVTMCEEMIKPYNRLMNAMVSQYTEEDEDSSGFTLV